MVNRWVESAQHRHFKIGILKGLLEGGAHVFENWKDWYDRRIEAERSNIPYIMEPPQLPLEFDTRFRDTKTLSGRISPRFTETTVRFIFPKVRQFYKDALAKGRNDGMTRAQELCELWYRSRVNGIEGDPPWLSMPLVHLILQGKEQTTQAMEGAHGEREELY